MTLYRVQRRFESCCLRINGLISSGLSYSISDKIAFETHVLHAVVKLQDYWCASCRQLIMLSCVGGYSTISGIILPRAANLPYGQKPMAWLRTNWTVKKMDNSWEPDWHVPFQCIRVAKLFNIANYITLTNALGAVTLVDNLRIARNTVVHSLPVTYSRYRSLLRSKGYGQNTDLVDYVLSRVMGTGKFVIDTWIDEMQLCLAAAIR